jgi:hypothetical protein
VELSSSRNAAFLLSLIGAFAACEVPDPEPDTGGLGGGEPSSDECQRGISVISTGYASTAVAFVDWEGRVISPRVITTASADTGLSAPLSGDVVAPTVATSSTETVLIDRFAGNVLTWIDLATGKPRAQLPVGTGFIANPQDYVQISETLGFVSRLEPNGAAGREPFDAGSDLLAIDPSVPAVVGRVGLEDVLAGEDASLLPRPARMAFVGGRVVVLLGVLSADFQSSGSARLAFIDPETRAVTDLLTLEGLQNCQALAPSPEGDRVAVGCTGAGFGLDGASDLATSGVAIVDVGADDAPPSVVSQFAASGWQRPPQFSIAFSAERRVLFPAFGNDPIEGGEAHGDDLVELDLDTGASRVLFTSQKAFDLSEVRCAAACGSCFATDARAVGVRRFTIEAGVASEAGLVQVDDGIGLAEGSEGWGPRYLGAL